MCDDKLVIMYVIRMFVFFQAEDGIRDLVRSRGLGDVYKRQNPVSSHFIINANQFDSYRLYDAKGVLVQIGSLTSVTRIEKCNLTSGIYIIQVTSSGGTIFYRKLLFL